MNREGVLLGGTGFIGRALPKRMEHEKRAVHILGRSNIKQVGKISDKTVSRYLNILEGIFMTWRLRPWHNNQGKREAKAPKTYQAGTGILHSLLGIAGEHDLLAHPKCGASWEGFVLHEIIRHTNAKRDEVYFLALHSGAELDLMIMRNGCRLGFEVKLICSPKVTPSTRSARGALELDHLYVVRHGEGEAWPLAQGISALPLNALCSGNITI